MKKYTKSPTYYQDILQDGKWPTTIEAFIHSKETYPDRCAFSVFKGNTKEIITYKEAYKNVDFVCDLDDGVGNFLFDMEQLKRVFINLIENSVAAMEDVEQPKIEISSKADRSRQIIRLSIGDNGPGVDDSKYAKLFEPYYSTKQGGSGLGLAIVSKVVEDHKGVIQACSNPGGGLRFNIELPNIKDETKGRHV